MDSIEQTEKLSSIEDVLDVVLDKQSVAEVKRLMQEKCQFYIEENVKMEACLKKLELLKQDLRPEAQKTIETLSNLQVSFNAKDCTAESILSSETEKLRVEKIYSSKMRMCFKMLYDLNEKLRIEIKQEKRDLTKWKSKLANTCDVLKYDIEIVEAKIKKYEKELLKLEKRYPWLCDTQLHLLNVSKEIENMMQLKQEKIELLKELGVYEGLQPDMNKAKEQLRELKEQHKEFTNNLVKERVKH